MSLTPQLHPTDIAALEQIEDREAREQAYNDNAIVKKSDPRGTLYTKGQQVGARPRSWQSLDLILRSDRNSAAALPENKLRTARVLTGFLIASAIVTVGGIASSAREGLDLSRPTGTSAVLLAGGAGMLAFGIATGVVWNQAKAGYQRAVDVYNDSLALRLGIANADGEYRPPEGVLVDEEGFIILDQRELSAPQLRPKPPPPVEPAPLPEAVESPPTPEDAGAPADPTAPSTDPAEPPKVDAPSPAEAESPPPDTEPPSETESKHTSPPDAGGEALGSSRP